MTIDMAIKGVGAVQAKTGDGTLLIECFPDLLVAAKAKQGELIGIEAGMTVYIEGDATSVRAYGAIKNYRENEYRLVVDITACYPVRYDHNNRMWEIIE